MRKLNQGTKEFVDVTVIDDQGTLTSLNGLGLQFKVMKKNLGTPQQDWTSGNNVGMVAFCLIDTNVPTTWAEDQYSLFLRFTLAPEIPIIGPEHFLVVAL
jgi:hypothetical protein